MIYMLTKNGLPATECVMARGVSKIVLQDPTIQKYLDNRSIMLGTIEPMNLPEGACCFAILNVDGHMVKLITYDETYEDESGQIAPYLPAGTVIMTAQAAVSMEQLPRSSRTTATSTPTPAAVFLSTRQT